MTMLRGGLIQMALKAPTTQSPEVIRQAKPRKVFVQANTVLNGDSVVLKEYEATPEGLIQSFVDRDYV